MDIKTPLTDREAGRVRTMLERRGRYIKLRELIAFSPADIAEQFKLNAQDIARFAGRRDEAAERAKL